MWCRMEQLLERDYEIADDSDVSVSRPVHFHASGLHEPSPMGRARHMKRLVAFAAAAAVLVAVFVGAPVAPASASTPTIVSASTIGEAPDYRSDKWANPWDFSDTSDYGNLPGLWNPGTNVSVSGGHLVINGAGQTFFRLLQTRSYPPAADDAFSRPLPPTTYSRISFRMYSPRESVANIRWADCLLDGRIKCENNRQFTVKEGWNTYDFHPMDLPPGPLTTQTHAWNRPVGTIDLLTNAYANEVLQQKIDWFRVYKPSGTTTVNVGPDGADEVWWDMDANQSNNVSAATAAKFAGPIGANGTATFNSSAFPPGTYRFYTVKNGTKSDYSQTLTINPKPRPVVIDPDMAGGDDWATVVRGDAWDFSQATDVSGWFNLGPGNPLNVNGGILSANSKGSAAPGDPIVEVAVPTRIDARLYHRYSVRYRLDGAFDLGAGAGGGTMARILWVDDEPGKAGRYHDSQDMLVETSKWHTMTVDLHSDPPGDIEDDSDPTPTGFGPPAYPWVYKFRWDPHEDAGGRGFQLDSIRLARNDRGKPNFAVRFEDKAWIEGTTVDIYLDTDRAGSNRTKIESDVPVAPGVNTYNLRTSVLASGSRYIYLVMKSPLGTSTTAYSTGPVDMGTWTGFKDVSANHAFRSQIDWLSAEMIAEGFADNSFRPSNSVSRQAAASFLWKYSGSPKAGGPSFSDVKPGHAFYDAIRWMVEQEIAKGFSDGTFKPTASVTRQALASFLHKLAGSPPVQGTSGFRDVSSTHPFAESITWLAKNQLATGYSDGTFRPGAPVARQAIAAMLAKYDAKFG